MFIPKYVVGSSRSLLFLLNYVLPRRELVLIHICKNGSTLLKKLPFLPVLNHLHKKQLKNNLILYQNTTLYIFGIHGYPVRTFPTDFVSLPSNKIQTVTTCILLKKNLVTPYVFREVRVIIKISVTYCFTLYHPRSHLY